MLGNTKRNQNRSSGVVDAESHLLRVVSAALERIPPPQAAEVHGLLEVVVKTPGRKLRGGRDGGNAAMPRSDREEDCLVGCDLAKLLAEKERRFVEQWAELVEDLLPDVDVDGPGVVQAEQILRQATDQKTGPRPMNRAISSVCSGFGMSSSRVWTSRGLTSPVGIIDSTFDRPQHPSEVRGNPPTHQCRVALLANGRRLAASARVHARRSALRARSPHPIAGRCKGRRKTGPRDGKAFSLCPLRRSSRPAAPGR